MTKLSYRSILPFLLLAVFSGCSTSPPTRLYLIEPILVTNASFTSANKTIVVGPVAVPEYLSRKEIQSHDHRYRVASAQFDRWAEPLEDNISAVVAENLAMLLPSNDLLLYPGIDGARADYTVRMWVHRFGSEPSGDVVLLATWRLDGQNSSEGVTRKARYVEPREGADIVSIVAAMSATLEQLTLDVATTIQAIESNDEILGARQ